jgi:MFS family permease
MPAQGRGELARNWPLLVNVVLGISLQASGIYALGQVTRQLEVEFNWSRTEVSAGLTASLLLTFLLAPVIGRLVDSMNARYLALPGSILAAMSMAAFSLADGSHTVWILLWCFQAVATSIAGPTVWISVLNSRFTKYRSFAIGIAMCGAGLAAGLAPPMMRLLIDTFNWHVAYQLMGLFWSGSCVVMTLFFFFDDRPRRGGADGKPGGRPVRNMRSLLLSTTFLKIGVSMFLLMGSISAFMIHLSPILVDKGFSLEAAAGLAGIGGVGTLLGKLSVGWLFDRVRQNLVIIGLTLDFSLACLLLALSGGGTSINLIACIVMGAAGGAILTISACLATRFFPAEDFGVVFGALASLMALSGALAPSGASMIHDATGAYTPAFWIGIAVAIASAALLMTLAPVKSEMPAVADPVEVF